eukprot:2686756-Amphidinium_carterae.1
MTYSQGSFFKQSSAIKASVEAIPSSSTTATVAAVRHLLQVYDRLCSWRPSGARLHRNPKSSSQAPPQALLHPCQEEAREFQLAFVSCIASFAQNRGMEHPAAKYAQNMR